MKTAEVMRRITGTGILPVVRASSPDEAMTAIDALIESDIIAIEITMTVPGAVRLIERAATRFGERVVIGAGTVLDSETARACTLAGAQFIVSPALDTRLIAMCRRHSVAVICGALTPTEVIAAWQAGADAVKIFPCGAMGGASYLKALKAPLPDIEMIPTGGVTLANAADFIEAGAMALGVGGELVDAQAIRDDRPQVVTERGREFIKIVRQTRARMRE